MCISTPAPGSGESRGHEKTRWHPRRGPGECIRPEMGPAAARIRLRLVEVNDRAGAYGEGGRCLRVRESRGSASDPPSSTTWTTEPPALEAPAADGAGLDL